MLSLTTVLRIQNHRKRDTRINLCAYLLKFFIFTYYGQIDLLIFR